MHKHILFILLIFLIPLKSQCQIEEARINKWIAELSNYRDYLINKHPNSTKELKQLIDKWNSFNTTENERIYMTLNVLFASEIEEMSFESIKKEAIKKKPNSSIATSFTEEDISIIKNNSELLNLIHIGLLKEAYPFKIDPNTKLFKEFQEYNINKTEKIGEIGCGSGTFGLLLNLIEPEINLYLNELNISFLRYIKSTLTNNEIFKRPEQINLVKGEKKNTNFESLNLDKIIIRNTFHHFKKKVKMLNSIRKSLKINGELYILESTTALNKDTKDPCEDILDKREIIGIITNNNFTLTEEVEFKTEVLLKFIAK